MTSEPQAEQKQQRRVPIVLFGGPPHLHMKKRRDDGRERRVEEGGHVYRRQPFYLRAEGRLIESDRFFAYFGVQEEEAML